MKVLEKIEKYLGEGSNDKVDLVCLECGKKFKAKPTFSGVKCPKCGSYDTEIQ